MLGALRHVVISSPPCWLCALISHIVFSVVSHYAGDADISLAERDEPRDNEVSGSRLDTYTEVHALLPDATS